MLLFEITKLQLNLNFSERDFNLSTVVTVRIITKTCLECFIQEDTLITVKVFSSLGTCW